MTDRISRRLFLKNTGLLSLAVPLTLDVPAWAVAKPRSLVLLHLAGGNDGFNTSVPYTSFDYYQHRPNLAVPLERILPLNARIGLPKEMRELAGLFSEGKLAVLPAIGYPKMSKSHFRSSDIMRTAVPDRVVETGWLPATQHSDGIPQRSAGAEMHLLDGDETSLAEKLNLVMERLQDGRTNSFHLTMSGFDTHADQSSRHPQLLKQLSQGLSGFQRDLERKGIADSTMVLGYSEFGRRLFENEEGGTDHGAATTMFVLGAKVRGGVYGEGTAILANGDRDYDYDFRCVYATILERWFGTDSASALAGRYDGVPFLT